MNFAGSWRRVALAVVGVLLLSPLAWGQGKKGAGAKEKPLTPAEKAAEAAFTKMVNASIDKGVAYLRKSQQFDGSWPRQEMGATALAGLALLESGLSPDDEVIRKAAAFVRGRAVTDTNCYSITTAVLFLDRLGDPQDIPLIEALAVRILAAQNLFTGAWSYTAPPPSMAEFQRLGKIVAAHKNITLKGRPAMTPRTYNDLPKEIRDQLDMVARGRGHVDKFASELSNTQFALLALWTAQRYGIPVAHAFSVADTRIRRTQYPSGTWSYLVKYQPRTDQAPQAAFVPSVQMTCAALMGLAMTHHIVDKSAKKKRDMTKDTAIVNGLRALIPTVGTPTGDLSKVPVLPIGEHKSYFALWSLERAAVLFDLKKIGGKDWYKWGAEILVRNQHPDDGSWKGEFWEGGADTCFALLFLKRADLVKDLTVKIKKKRPEFLEAIESEGAKTGSKIPPAPRGPGGRQSWLRPVDGPALVAPRPLWAAWERSIISPLIRWSAL